MSSRADLAFALELFRGALLAVVPTFEAANVAWRNEDAYDGWDRVAEALHLTFVIDSVLHDNDVGGNPSSLPTYGFTYTDYRDFETLILVQPAGDVLTVFRAFCTKVTPFDMVQVVKVARDSGMVVGQEVMDWEDVEPLLWACKFSESS